MTLPRKSTTRHLLLAALAVIATLLIAQLARAEALKDHLRRISRDPSSNARISPGKYLVELKSTLADRTRESASDGLESTARLFSPSVKVLRTYNSLFNGFAIKSNSPLELQRVTARSDVAAVYPVFRQSLDPRERGSLNEDANGKKKQKVELSTTLAMTGVDRARKELKLTGRGVKVAIIDSGLDYTHPAFARPGMKCEKLGDRGCRVAASRAFVGDDFDPDSGKPPVAGGDIMDCDGHGTHVAGIAAARTDTFTGVAFEADLLIYKVFGCAGTTETDIILAAMERAHKDGANVINISIGGPGTLHDFPTAAAATKLAEKGVIVAASQGNDGTHLALFAAGAPAAGRKVFSVGSFDNNGVVYNATTITNLPGFKESGYDFVKDARMFAPDAPVEVVPSPFSPDAKPGSGDGFEGDGCQPFAQGDQFKGKAALVKAGFCTVDVKAKNAMRAGATGLVVYGWRMDMANVWFGEPNSIPDMPIALITGQVGRAIWDHHAAKPGAPSVSLTFHNRLTSVQLLDDGGSASGFSSYGPGGLLEIKPDISAPGGNIYSTVPTRNGSWAVYSGTSMSSPFIAGFAALAKQRFPRITYAELQRLLQSTARPGISRIHEAPDSIARQGPGLIDAYAALTSTVVVSPHKLEWLDGNHRREAKVTITNRGPKPISFTLSHLPAMSVTIDAFPPPNVKEYANVTIDRSSLTIHPGRTAQVAVAATVDGAAIPDYSVMSGWIVLNSTDKHQPALRVPYLLMKGNYSTYPMISDPTHQYPFLSTSLLPELGYPAGKPNVTIKRLANETMGPFTLHNLDRPVVMLSLLHYSRMAALALFDASTNAKLGYAATMPFAPAAFVFLPVTGETSAATGKRVFGWSGEYTERMVGAQVSKKVPDGEYYFMAEVALPGTDDKWMDRMSAYWRSPKIVVRRNAGNATSV